MLHTNRVSRLVLFGFCALIVLTTIERLPAGSCLVPEGFACCDEVDFVGLGYCRDCGNITPCCPFSFDIQEGGWRISSTSEPEGWDLSDFEDDFYAECEFHLVKCFGTQCLSLQATNSYFCFSVVPPAEPHTCP